MTRRPPVQPVEAPSTEEEPDQAPSPRPDGNRGPKVFDPRRYGAHTVSQGLRLRALAARLPSMPLERIRDTPLGTASEAPEEPLPEASLPPVSAGRRPPIMVSARSAVAGGLVLLGLGIVSAWWMARGEPDVRPAAPESSPRPVAGPARAPKSPPAPSPGTAATSAPQPTAPAPPATEPNLSIPSERPAALRPAGRARQDANGDKRRASIFDQPD